MVAEKLLLPAPRSWPSPRRFVAQQRRLVRTHAFRLAALYFLVFAASVLSVLFFVYWTSADFVERQTEATLDAEITGLAEQYAQRGLSGLVQIVAARSAGDPGDAMLYLVTDPDGRPLAGNIAGWPLGVPARSGWLSFTVGARVHGQVVTHPARASLIIMPAGYRLLVGRDISDAAAFRERVKLTLLWSGLAALGVGVLGGAAMSRNLLRRVELVNRTSERVMAGNLSDRVPLDGTSDEFDLLAANLNRMLDQIERLMTAMREVTDNVAHDLKTPLARLRARLELALIGPAEAGLQREAIRAAIEEADRMLATFNALLRIAEAEAGARTGSGRARRSRRGRALGRRILRAGGRGKRIYAGAGGRARGSNSRRPAFVVASARQSARQRAQIFGRRRIAKSWFSATASMQSLRWPIAGPASRRRVAKSCLIALSGSSRAAARPETVSGSAWCAPWLTVTTGP